MNEKHAKWLINCDGYYPYCSNCLTEPQSGKMTKYCPKCGAKMDLKDNKNNVANKKIEGDKNGI